MSRHCPCAGSASLTRLGPRAPGQTPIPRHGATARTVHVLPAISWRAHSPEARHGPDTGSGTEAPRARGNSACTQRQARGARAPAHGSHQASLHLEGLHLHGLDRFVQELLLLILRGLLGRGLKIKNTPASSQRPLRSQLCSAAGPSRGVPAGLVRTGRPSLPPLHPTPARWQHAPREPRSNCAARPLPGAG